MTQTRHGHHIPGTEYDDETQGIAVARCGGVYACIQCIEDVREKGNGLVGLFNLLPVNPPQFEAVHYTAESDAVEIVKWIKARGGEGHYGERDWSDKFQPVIVITASDHAQRVRLGQWIVVESPYVFKAYTDTEFKSLYRPIEQPKEETDGAPDQG